MLNMSFQNRKGYPPRNESISHLGKRKIIFKIVPVVGDMSVPRRDILSVGRRKNSSMFSKTSSKLMTKELPIWCHDVVFPTPTRVFHTSVFHRWMTIYRKIPPIYTRWMNVCSIYQAHRCVKDMVTHLWWGFFSKKIPQFFQHLFGMRLCDTRILEQRHVNY